MDSNTDTQSATQLDKCPADRQDDPDTQSAAWLDKCLGRTPLGNQLSQPNTLIPLLLSLPIEPNLPAFAQTLSPKALQYLHLRIHIGKLSCRTGNDHCPSQLYSNRHGRQ